MKRSSLRFNSRHLLCAVPVSAAVSVFFPHPVLAQQVSIVVAQSSSLCVDISGFSAQSELPVQQWTCNGGANQKFGFTPTTDGAFSIKPQHDGLCLDTASDGWQVVQNTCNGSATQRWLPQAGGNGMYALVGSSGGCLNVSGDSKQQGGKLILWSCDGSLNEQFSIPGLALSGTSTGVSAVPPVAGYLETFHYIASRDGLGLLTGGPTETGYAADAATRPITLEGTGGIAGFFEPRNPDWGLAVSGGTDVYSGAYQWNVDPEDPAYGGFSPFSITPAGLRIRAQLTSSLPAAAQAAVPGNPVNGAPYTYVSGVLTTRDSFSQQGGCWGVKATMTNGTATWPALWLYAQNEHPPETDILEQVGGLDPANIYRSSVHSQSGGFQSQLFSSGGDPSATAHWYEDCQTDTAIQFYLDGTATGDPVDITTHPEFQQPMYLLAGMQIGSTIDQWVPAPNGITPNPSDLTISEIAAWQAPGPISVALQAGGILDTTVVGGTVGALDAPSFGESTGDVFSIVSDPDNLFAISGANLVTRVPVPPYSTKSSHPVTVKVTDNEGRSRRQAFTLPVVTGAPSQANLLTSQDLTGGFWSGYGLTATATDMVRETGGYQNHAIGNANVVPHAAGATMLVASEDVTPSAGRTEFYLQVTDSSYLNGCYAYFNTMSGNVEYSSCTNGYSGVAPFMVPLGNNRWRAGFRLTTDAASTGLRFISKLATGYSELQDDTTYVGVATDGAQIDNLRLYDVNGPAATP